MPKSGSYEKAFFEITMRPSDWFDPKRERYVWFNFDGDMLSVGDTDLHEFLAVAKQIRQLQLRSGYLMTEDTYFPCGPKNVDFIGPEAMGGTMMNSIELDAMVTREHEELYRLA
ncbi:hypothetical protein Ct61P_10079 [Colletotrichum tofieldiae]|nr:hypothetical protein Ct61P_10079 [Colletotrichum tofieldiae]